MFAASFSQAFAGRAPRGGFIGPVMAQAAMIEGADVAMDGAQLLIGGNVLIGPAGKVYEFSSPNSAAVWVENTMNVGAREWEILAAMKPELRARWIEGKRKRLAKVATRVVDAALRVPDEAKRAALLDEADFCLKKWG